MWIQSETEFCGTICKNWCHCGRISLVERAQPLSAGPLSRLRDDPNHPYNGMVASYTFCCGARTIPQRSAAWSPLQKGASRSRYVYGMLSTRSQKTKENRAGSKKHTAYQVTLTLSADLHQGCRVCVTSYTANIYTCLRTRTRVSCEKDPPPNF